MGLFQERESKHCACAAQGLVGNASATLSRLCTAHAQGPCTCLLLEVHCKRVSVMINENEKPATNDKPGNPPTPQVATPSSKIDSSKSDSRPPTASTAATTAEEASAAVQTKQYSCEQMKRYIAKFDEFEQPQEYADEEMYYHCSIYDQEMKEIRKFIEINEEIPEPEEVHVRRQESADPLAVGLQPCTNQTNEIKSLHGLMAEFKRQVCALRKKTGNYNYNDCAITIN
ncbi:unnamed protein product [Nesidiocoris tenuis]|uniref:Uncharacterized protein n=1 Tax=Nesidiocoris tenuis TaxID=355587 RepID=A0A6H5H7R7_9HEMI|nr:unnamed protein product [Nesidiocoris tenuis]